MSDQATADGMTFERHEIRWTPAKVSRFWDYYASEPAYREVYFSFRVGRRVARYVKRRVGWRKVERILDFGCGRGDLIAAFLPHLGARQRIYGLDFSPRSVAEVTERFGQERSFAGAELVAELPSGFPSGHFDVIIATEVVEHLEEEYLDSMLRECSRLLARGGSLVLTTPNGEDLDATRVLCPDCGCIYHPWQHVRTWTEESLRRKVEEYGFRTRHLAAVSWSQALQRLAAAFRLASKWSLVYIGRNAGR